MLILDTAVLSVAQNSENGRRGYSTRGPAGTLLYNLSGEQGLHPRPKEGQCVLYDGQTRFFVKSLVSKYWHCRWWVLILTALADKKSQSISCKENLLQEGSVRGTEGWAGAQPESLWLAQESLSSKKETRTKIVGGQLFLKKRKDWTSGSHW